MTIEKIIPRHTLKVNKWLPIYEGKSIPSYCKYCRCQTMHKCIGSRKDGQALLYKFECTVCKEKLEGRLNETSY